MSEDLLKQHEDIARGIRPKRLGSPAVPSNKGVPLTAYSRRSALTPAAGSADAARRQAAGAASCLAFPRRHQRRISGRVTPRTDHRAIDRPPAPPCQGRDVYLPGDYLLLPNVDLHCWHPETPHLRQGPDGRQVAGLCLAEALLVEFGLPET